MITCLIGNSEELKYGADLDLRFVYKMVEIETLTEVVRRETPQNFLKLIPLTIQPMTQMKRVDETRGWDWQKEVGVGDICK